MLENIYKIKDFLAGMDKVLIIIHQRPDGDACGSALAMSSYLKSLGKQTSIFSADPPPSYFYFLPSISEITNDKNIFQQNWQAVIFLDCGDIKNSRLPIELSGHLTIINIDHHFTNTGYGDFNLVDASASSTCEVVYNFLKKVDFEIDKNMATCLLTGIMTDTGGFSNSATSRDSLDIASELVQSGGKINYLYGHLTKNKSMAGLRLWGLVMSRLKFNQRYNLVYTYVKDQDFRDYNISEEEADGLTDFFNVIDGVDLVVFLRLRQGETKVSLRTTKNNIDVSRLAQLFGGGGHKKASGFTVPWQITEKDGKLVIE